MSLVLAGAHPSPELFAVCHVLLRHHMPRYPLCALFRFYPCDTEMLALSLRVSCFLLRLVAFPRLSHLVPFYGSPSGPPSGNVFFFQALCFCAFWMLSLFVVAPCAAESLPTVCVISYPSSCNLSICRAYRLDAHFLYSSLKLHDYLASSLLGIYPLWRGFSSARHVPPTACHD